MNRSLVFDLATAAFIGKREDALFLGPGGTGKSHLAQAIGQAAIQQGYKVLYRETHILLDELAEAVADGTRSEYMESVPTVPLLIIDDFGMRKLPHTAAEDLLEIIMRRYERVSTLLTSNRPVEDGANCSATSPPSAPCSIVCCITATCSSAARGAGAPRPLPHRKEKSSLDGDSVPSGIYRFSPGFLARESELEWGLTLSESRPLSRRSGRIPAWPYPPLRC